MQQQQRRQQYSLWIRPSGREGEELARVISEMADQHGTEAFEPHVTLLSVFELERKDLEVID